MSDVSGLETEFLNVGNVVVTNARFLVDGQTYTMNSVTSVKQGCKKDDPIAGGLVFITVSILPLSYIDDSSNTVAQILLGLFGVTLICVGIYGCTLESKPTYSVILQTSSGEVQALASTDKVYIESIISALNNSIIHRG